MQSLKEAGKSIKMLDEEPEINIYEQLVLTAAFTCKTVSDLVSYAKINGVMDVSQFTDLSLKAQQRIKSNATT